jgi:hypothetical protein
VLIEEIAYVKEGRNGSLVIRRRAKVGVVAYSIIPWRRKRGP